MLFKIGVFKNFAIFIGKHNNFFCKIHPMDTSENMRMNLNCSLVIENNIPTDKIISSMNSFLHSTRIA